MKGNSPINTIFGKLVFGCCHYFSHSQSSVLLTYKRFIYLKIYRTAFNIYSDCKSKKQKKNWQIWRFSKIFLRSYTSHITILLTEGITSTKVITIVHFRHKSIIIHLYHDLIVQNHLMQ